MVLAIIGLVASVFYASTISIPLNTTGAFSGSKTGMSDFLQLLRNQGYSVMIANTTQQEQSFASTNGTVFFLISPDKPISSSFAQTLYSGYENGSLSLVIAEDNITNEAPLLSDFGANVTGAAINDGTSSFTDQRIFDVVLNLGAATSGQLDIASPIILNGSSLMPVAQSSQRSTDSKNSTMGPRTVIAASSSVSNARAILVSSFSPFTNCGLSQCSNINDTSLVLSIVNWASDGNASRLIVIDGSQYTSAIPPIHLGIPMGTIMLFVLQMFLNRLGGYGISSITSSGGGFSLLGHFVPNSVIIFVQLIAAFIVLLFIRNRIKAWFAREKPVKDDQPLPLIEKNVVSQSKQRIDFVTLSRDKSFYVATLAQLYEAIDDVAKLELGSDIKELTLATLTTRLGTEKAMRAYKSLRELSRYSDYANNKQRILFPPGLSWKRKVRSMTLWAEQFLNDLGLTMSGKAGGQQMEYALKR